MAVGGTTESLITRSNRELDQDNFVQLKSSWSSGGILTIRRWALAGRRMIQFEAAYVGMRGFPARARRGSVLHRVIGQRGCLRR